MDEIRDSRSVDFSPTLTEARKKLGNAQVSTFTDTSFYQIQTNFISKKL